MNWQDLIAELQTLGMTQPQIAEACRCAQTTISAMATGKTVEPKHSLGEALKVLLREKRSEAVMLGGDTGARRRSTDIDVQANAAGG